MIHVAADDEGSSLRSWFADRRRSAPIRAPPSRAAAIAGRLSVTGRDARVKSLRRLWQAVADTQLI